MKTQTLYTVQTPDAWAALQSTGSITGSLERIDCESFKAAYQWMVQQMRQRLPDAPTCNYPMWAWHTHSGKAKPDLRCQGLGHKGHKEVLLKLEVPAGWVLLSDFYRWHHVLNNWNLALNESDDDQFWTELKAFEKTHGVAANSQPHPNPKLQSRIEASWQAIFDLESHHEYVDGPQQQIQACLPKITLEQVKSARFFQAR